MAYGPLMLTLYTTPHSRIQSNHKGHHHLDTDTYVSIVSISVISRIISMSFFKDRYYLAYEPSLS